MSKNVAIPRSIWAIGFVSLFMDSSSELIHSLLPVFMVSTLGATMTTVGLVEGIAESIALIVKIFSGALSDFVGKRKFLTMVGYGMAALTKPLFPIATTVGMVATARFIDRVGKGIRGAPRDALVGDIAPVEIRGACFGLRQSLDTVGAFLGPLLAIIGMMLLAGNIRAVLWIAVVPAAISVFILAVGVEEPARQRETKTKAPLCFRDIRYVGAAYWKLVAIAGLFTLARFSDAFLILKAQSVGLSATFVPLVMILMNIVYATVAYPAGIFSDTANRKTVLLIGTMFLIVANVMLGFAHNLWMLMPGVILWGLHLAFTQGLLAAMVTDTTPSHLRGTAYGVYNFICGIGMLIASVLAGFLWDSFGASATFFSGAVLTTVAFIGLLVVSDDQWKRG